MKRSCIAGAVLTSVLAGSAMAADLPVKAPVPRPVSDWTGFYIGVHGGYGWARPSISDFDLNRSNPLGRLLADVGFDENFTLHAPRLRGAIFGGHAGYNWQWGQRSVVGLEIDYSAANIKSTQEASIVLADGQGTPLHVDTRTLQSKLDGLASARARALASCSARSSYSMEPAALRGVTRRSPTRSRPSTRTFQVQSVPLSTPAGPVPITSVGWRARAPSGSCGKQA